MRGDSTAPAAVCVRVRTVAIHALTHSLTHSFTHSLTHSSHSLTHSPLAITRALTQVVRRHFREKRDAIEKQCNDWLGLDPNNHALRTSVAAVRAELRKLE